jgi:hypothetical protein
MRVRWFAAVAIAAVLVDESCEINRCSFGGWASISTVDGQLIVDRRAGWTLR